jgi:hypothetical protein
MPDPDQHRARQNLQNRFVPTSALATCAEIGTVSRRNRFQRGWQGAYGPHVAEARRMVQRQKGLIVRLGAAGSTLDAQKILWLLESNLRRLENHRDFLKGNFGGASDDEQADATRTKFGR